MKNWFFGRKKKIPFLKLFDILAAVVLIGQVIGRWGNFVNIEAYGAETTLPWRMGILTYGPALLDNGNLALTKEQYVHPTFLYESLWNLCGLLIVHLGLYPRKKFDGEIFCFYLMWYGFGRMLIESLRTDSLMLGNLRVSQGVGFVSLILGIMLMTALAKKAKSAKGVEYRPVYEGADGPAEEEADPSEAPAAEEASGEEKAEDEGGTDPENGDKGD